MNKIKIEVFSEVLGDKGSNKITVSLSELQIKKVISLICQFHI